jgi:hypothetical protein
MTTKLKFGRGTALRVVGALVVAAVVCYGGVTPALVHAAKDFGRKDMLHDSGCCIHNHDKDAKGNGTYLSAWFVSESQ